MKIFLDTADREQIKKWCATGIVDGVTTNPTLLGKEGASPKKVLVDICKMVDGPVSIEVVEKSPEAVFSQAKEISRLANNAVVKIPFAVEYFSAIKKLVQEGVNINVTLVFTELQALLVAKLSPTFISPFIGRLDDIGIDGMKVIETFVKIKQNYGLKSEILAASIRNISHWQRVAILGADIVTVPVNVLEQATKHPLTEIGIKVFDNDWRKLKKASLL